MVEAVHLSIEKFGNFLLFVDSKQHLLVKASVLMNVSAKKARRVQSCFGKKS